MSADRDDDLTLGWKLREHLGLQPPHEAVAAQVPVKPLLAELAVELAAEARPRAELMHPPDHPKLSDQLVGVVEHRRPGEREAQAIGATASASLRTACVRFACGFLT